MSQQLFGARNPIGETVTIAGVRFTVVGRLRTQGPGQQLQRPRQQQDLHPVRGDVADPPASRTPIPGRCRSSSCRRRRRRWPRCRTSWPAAPAASPTSTGRSSARCAASWPAARASIRTTPKRSRCGTRRMQSLFFERIVYYMRQFFTHGRRGHAGPRRHRRDEHHADRGQGADARDRRPQGARRDDPCHPAAVLPRRLRADDDQRPGRPDRGRRPVRWRSTRWRRCRSASPG